MHVLESTSTWSIISISFSKTPISFKWVYKIKNHSYDFIERYKIRLVAKDYTQLKGLDFFYRVVKLTMVRTLISLVSIKNWF